MSNKALWQRAFTTDPRAVKAITGKQYAGNSPKPYWIVERLTDEFGPCGIGWGFTILNERFERFSDTDTLHIASVRLWYLLDGQRGELEQIGQTKASYMTGSGKFMLDEDAPKKSVTDALVKCASYLGFAGDIFSGRWDDSKYVAEAGKEWRKRDEEAKTAEVKPIKAGAISATDGAGEGLADERKQAIREMVAEWIDAHHHEQDMPVISAWYAPETFQDNDERVFAWALLKTESKLRALIKANSPSNQKAAA